MATIHLHCFQDPHLVVFFEGGIVEAVKHVLSCESMVRVYTMTSLKSMSSISFLDRTLSLKDISAVVEVVWVLTYLTAGTSSLSCYFMFECG